MPIKRDLEAYYRSMAAEIEAVKDRVRYLIGDAHWLTDGEYKEAVLRSILRRHIPSSYEVGRGFVCFPNEVSNQLDVLITSVDTPTLFKDNDLRIVTAEFVEAIIEVKTSQTSPSTLRKTLYKLGKQIKEVRENNLDKECIAGLFVYEDSGLSSDQILSALQDAVKGDLNRVINIIVIGTNLFVRFWPDGKKVNEQAEGPVWHFYDLEGIAQGYFVSNIVWGISKTPLVKSHFAWFAVKQGKRAYRRQYATLEGTQIRNLVVQATERLR